MTIVRRTPFGDLLSLRQAMDRLFEESFVSPRTWQFGEGQLVPVDVYATNDDVVVEAILPGVKPEEVEITVEGNTLSIAGDTSSMIPGEKGSCCRRSGAVASCGRSLCRRAWSRTRPRPPSRTAS